MANDVEHLFMCLFVINSSSSLKCLFMSFAHFLIEFFILLLSFVYSRYWTVVQYVVYKYFPSFHSLSFHLPNKVFHKGKLFLLMRSNLSNFSFIDYSLIVISISLHPALNHKDFLIFSSKSLIVLCFTFKCMNQFLYQVWGLDEGLLCLWMPSAVCFFKKRNKKDNFPSSIELLLPFVKN